MINKKGNMWLWILILLILIVAALVVYLVMSGNGSEISSIFSGNSIPQPPALPSG